MPMQNVEKGRLLEVATKLYLENQSFTVYFWQEWASQKGLHNHCRSYQRGTQKV